MILKALAVFAVLHTGAAPVHAAAPDSTDAEIFAARMRWATGQRLDTLPIGDIVARVGRTFIGAPYVAQSLEEDGPEHLVVNLRAFDCVTFVENSLALARTIRLHGNYSVFRGELKRIRYRGGNLDGYPSRLHYFSEWIADNEDMGLVHDMTPELGGVIDSEPIDFMSTHRSSYRQLADAAAEREIEAIEKRLSANERRMIPDTAIAAISSRIRNGDIIAVTTNVHGLDISHTGIALWDGDVLRLMHAPLVGTVVQISETSLADRIVASKSQDGIMVARPR